MSTTINEDKIAEFKTAIEKRKTENQSNSFMKVLKIEKKEDVHSNFLAFLFNKDAIGTDLVMENLKALLNQINTLENIEIKNFSVKREHCFNNKKSRADLYFKITTNSSIIHILIENKIDHIISDEQIDNYITWKNEQKEERYLILLLPDYYEINSFNLGLKSDKKGEKNNEAVTNMNKKINDNFLTINYSYINKNILKQSLENTSSEAIKNLILNYINCLKNVQLIKKEDEDELWNKYGQLFSEIKNAITNNNINKYNAELLEIYRTNIDFILTILNEETFKEIQNNLEAFRIGNSGKLVNRSTLLHQIAERYQDDMNGTIKNVIAAYFENVEHDFFYTAEEYAEKSFKHKDWFTQKNENEFYYLNAWNHSEIINFIDYLNENLEGSFKIERYK